jgi:two-component sensor histidine kinase
LRERRSFMGVAEGRVLLDGDLRILDINTAAASLVGIPIAGDLGLEALVWRWDPIREDGSAFPKGETPLVSALLRGETLRAVVLGIRSPASGERLWLDIAAVPDRREGWDRPSGYVITLFDITESKRARDRLHRKIATMNAISDYSIRLADATWEGMYTLIVELGRDIFKASAAAIARYDVEGKALVLEEIAWSEIEKGSVLRLIGRGVRGLAAPVGDDEYRIMMDQKIGVSSTLHEFSFGKIPMAIGDTIEKALGIGWFRGLVLSSQGKLFGGLGLAGLKGQEAPEGDELRVFAEITANAIKRKQAEESIKRLLEEKELLLHEVHHRLKNNMNTMISLLSLQAGAYGDGQAAEVLKDAMARLQSMSTLYDRLYRAEDLQEMSLGEYLPTLVREIVGIFPNGGTVEVKASVDEIRLDVQRLSLLGIIVNELVTNAMKYAFTGREHGEISVSARLKGNRVVVRIADDGAGLPPTIDIAKSPGFGLGLIRTLTKQLDATIAIERRRGTCFAIEFDRG